MVYEVLEISNTSFFNYFEMEEIMIEKKQMTTFGLSMSRSLAIKARIVAAQQNKSRSAFISEVVEAAVRELWPPDGDDQGKGGERLD